MNNFQTTREITAMLGGPKIDAVPCNIVVSGPGDSGIYWTTFLVLASSFLDMISLFI